MKEKLFAVYLGGKTKGCNIELHDVVFVIGSSIESTHPYLVKKWFGNPDQFHIDSYIILEHVDGHEVQLTKTPPENEGSSKLYFINLGAYKPGEFTEYHQNGFYVADSPLQAVKRAKSELCQGLETVHKDDVLLLDKVGNSLDYDVDDIMEIGKVDDYYIHLTPSNVAASSPISAYITLDELVAKQ